MEDGVQVSQLLSEMCPFCARFVRHFHISVVGSGQQRDLKFCLRDLDSVCGVLCKAYLANQHTHTALYLDDSEAGSVY